MTIYRIFITALIVLANTSVAMAQIYKCDGPDGPIYSDRECATDAATVEIPDSAGLTGISDEEISELAEKKSDRDKARDRNNDGIVIENQSTTELTTYNDARRFREPDQLKQRIDSGVSDNTPQQRPKTKRNPRN
jgi:hypothetical protein